MKKLYHSPTHIVKCVSEYIFLIQKKPKVKETKEEKRIIVENLTGYCIFCKSALCTFNLSNQVVNFSWLLYEFNVVYVQQEKYSICYIITTYKVNT